MRTIEAIKSTAPPPVRVPASPARPEPQRWVSVAGNLAAERMLVQRACACGGSCPECEEEEERAYGLMQRTAWGAGAPLDTTLLERMLQRSQGSPLDSSTRAGFEPRFGADFSSIRVHTDSAAAEAARLLSAHAFTTGQHIYFAPERYQPHTASGQQLLAHELTHTLQKGGSPEELQTSVRVSRPGDAHEQEADFIARQVMQSGLVTENTLYVKGVPAVGQKNSVSAPRISDASGIFRQPAKVETDIYIPGEMSRAYWQLSPEARADVNAEVDRLFYQETGLPAGRKLDPGSPADRPYVRLWLRIRDQVMGRRPRGQVLPVAAPRGMTCSCDPVTQQAYDAQTFSFIRSIEPYVTSFARIHGVSPMPIAGAIADEYDTRRGFRGIVDSIQDGLIDALPEFAIDIDRFFDIHAKLLNTLENDIGPANIKVRTALELVQAGELEVPGSPPSEVQVNRIVDLLLTERGTVAATTAVIAKAERLFGPHLGDHPEDLRQAVLLEYFKQGDSYYRRFADALRKNPAHKVCPGDDGCQFMFNRLSLLQSLGAVPRTASRVVPRAPGLAPAGPSGIGRPMLPTTVAAIRLKSIRFLSDQGMMKDNRTGWEDSGDYFPEPEWVNQVPEVMSHPISHTKGARIYLDLVADVVPATMTAVSYALQGRSSRSFLSFETSGTLTGGQDQHILIASRAPLPDRIEDYLQESIDWSATVANRRQRLGRSMGHDIFVTYGLPKGGVTYKRMATAVRLTKGFGNRPNDIVSGQMRRFPEYNLKRPFRGNIWPLADSISESAECQAIVRFVLAVNAAVGLPGTVRGVAIYASPDAPTVPLLAPLVETGGATGGMFLFPLQPGTGYLAGLYDVADQANNYEAALEFDYGGEVRYYPGGVPGGVGLRATRDVLYVFKKMAWGEWDPVEGKWKPVVLIHCYQPPC